MFDFRSDPDPEQDPDPDPLSRKRICIKTKRIRNTVFFINNVTGVFPLSVTFESVGTFFTTFWHKKCADFDCFLEGKGAKQLKKRGREFSQIKLFYRDL